uniref:Transmembrane protein n=1 Tax=Steinernema glaseri TaxID=37863 RepID=A0A1I7ZNU8_9BILA
MPSAEPSAGNLADQQLDSLLELGSKAFNFISNVEVPANDSPRSPGAPTEPRASPLSSIASMLSGGGGQCFKTCGMEDIQNAATKAAELFTSLRSCALVLTVVTVVCMLILTTVITFRLLRSRVRVDDSQQSRVHLLDRTLSLFNGREQKAPPPPPKDDLEKSTVFCVRVEFEFEKLESSRVRVEFQFEKLESSRVRVEFEFEKFESSRVRVEFEEDSPLPLCDWRHKGDANVYTSTGTVESLVLSFESPVSGDLRSDSLVASDKKWTVRVNEGRKSASLVPVPKFLNNHAPLLQ